MALMLGCDSLTKSFGARTLFRGLSISFNEGERVGLIGPNGSGKSTLLQLLAGLEQADSGQVLSKRRLRLAYLPQEESFRGGATVQQVLVEAQAEDHHVDEHDRGTQASIMMGRMGFEDPDRPVEALSGGWRKRLALARELIKGPELLLLDEPTNHLDVEGILWLEKLLKSASFGFLLVSHDRYILENTTNRMVELSRAYAEGYFSINGPYSQFLEKREEFLEAQKSEQQALASRVRREIEWLRRGAKARTTKAKGRIEQAGRMMDDLAELKVRNTQGGSAAIDFTASGRQTRKLLEARSISKSLGGKPLFQKLDLVLSPGLKLGLLGPNGSGKSSLIRVLSGELQPDSGSIKRADGLKVVRFEQNRASLDKDVTLKVALSPKSETVTYRGGSMHVSGWARRFLFRTEQLDMPVRDLSGGEQSRILIAQLMLQPADILILDEPTNDLDISTLEVLEESLEDFPGALVLVTHDRFMLDNLSTDLLALDGQGNASIYADLAQWEAAQARPAEARKPAPAKAAPTAPTPKPASRKLTYMEQREWEQMEGKILDAEGKVEEFKKQMEDPAVLSNRDRLHVCCEELGKAEEMVRHLYARWAELESRQKG